LSRTRRKLGWIAKLLTAAEHAQDADQPPGSR
jgi:hypothetical protein